MLHKLLCIVALISIGTGCLASRMTAAVEKEATANRMKPYQEASAALSVWQESEGCMGQERDDVLAKMKSLEDNVSFWNRARVFSAYESEARSQHAEVAFAFADESLNRGCLDDADKTYRRLLELYAGADSGIRDRAKLGIEDVRAARWQAEYGE